MVSTAEHESAYEETRRNNAALVALVVAGDLDAAKRLADATPDSVSMSARMELMLDILNAVATPSDVDAMELERIREELRDDGDHGGWVARFCPELLRRFEAHDPAP